jgi:hypothetical protein
MLWASAVALPLVALGVIGVVIGTSGPSRTASHSPPPGQALPAVTASAPPEAARFAAQCTKVLQRLPVQLHGLAPRVVHTTPDTPFVVAWGDPPVILRCGVARPAVLHPGSSAELLSATGRGGPYFDVTRSGDDEVWTSVDRAVYIAVAVPLQYASGPVPPLARAIAAALPPVCTTSYTAPLSQRCTRRP